METSILSFAEPPVAVQHLRTGAARLGIKEVTSILLSKVDTESLPPRIFSLWLAAGGDCEAIRQGLSFQNSQTVRRASIARFGRLLHSSRYKDVWDAIGGASGIVDYLATASVYDVRNFCNQIRRSATAQTCAASRAALVDELYERLRMVDAAGPASQDVDRRPLSSFYHTIYPACSQKLVLATVDCKSGIRDVEGGQTAFFAHTAVFRSKCVAEIRDPTTKLDMQKVRALLRIRSNDGGTLQDPGVSGNSQFALEVLEALATRHELEGDSKAILSDISAPLFRRLARRKALPGTMVRATLAYVAFTQRHVSSYRSLDDLCDGPGASLIQNWGRCPSRLQDSLIILRRLAAGSYLPQPREWLRLVRLVPRPLRTQLLRAVSCCDLTTKHGLEQSRLRWDSELLLALPRAQARQILERLVEMGSPTLNEYYAVDSRQAELTLLRIKLARTEPDLLPLATAAVEEKRTEAARAREQAHRGVCVSYALQFAAASLNLELYRDVSLWTRRYIKDPLTAIEVFRGPAFIHDENTAILCGFGEKPYLQATLYEVAADVKLANATIIEYAQTACQAQLEPGFQAHNWRNVLGLMSNAVCERYRGINVLQDTLHASDDEMFEAVWHDTFETCQTLEVLGMDKRNTALEFDQLGGPLMRSGSHVPKLRNPRPATLRFLDMLAKARNTIWEEYRRNQFPATLLLPEPYPRGLPLECLIPVDLEECHAGPHLPYLLSRAERVVFVPADVAMMPQLVSDEDVYAIGSFVESWSAALQNYVYLRDNRGEAALAAWKHAIGPLSTTRMSAIEAHTFWSTVFSESLSHTDLSGPWTESPDQPRPPQLPDAGDDEQPIEWNPEIDVKSFEIKSRRLEPTRLDSMLHTSMCMVRTINTGPWPEATPEVPSRSLSPFWSRWNHSCTMSFATREALVTAAILHISATNSLSSGILSEPYPSEGDPRFPALYLDSDFLDREDPKRCKTFVWDTLTRLVNDAPPALLLRLAESLVKASANGKGRMPIDALKVLRILIKGDRPQVALNLVQDVILNRPDDSAWQRLLLSEGLLNSLPRAVAQRFLAELVAAIRQRLSEHASHKDKITAAPTTPRIKITTVKMISRLLLGASFVDVAFATSILIDLLANSTHIDIRVSVVDSLLDILKASPDAVLCDHIIAALELHAVPVMSSMNERTPMSRVEWDSCDAANLPDLGKETRGTMPPLISCMLSCISEVNENMRKQLFDRILIPTLLENAKINMCWTRKLLQSYGIGSDSLPDAPTNLNLLSELLKWPAYIPASWVDLWLRIMTVVLKPPPGVMAMNNLIATDTKLSTSSNGQHWLGIWGTHARKFILRTSTRLATMLSREWQTVRPDGISIEHVQSAVMQQFKLMLSILDSVMEDGSWNIFINDLKPPQYHSKNVDLWHHNVKPLLQQFMDNVTALRTQTWQRGENRSPVILPDTLPWQLWLLTAPSFTSDATRKEEMKLFASSVSELLVEICNSRRSYIKKYDAIVKFILNHGTSTDRINLALIFGSLDGVDMEHLDAAHDLRIDLACRQLESVRAQPPKGELVIQVRSMIRDLANCSDEDTRSMVNGLAKRSDEDTRSMVDQAWYFEQADI